MGVWGDFLLFGAVLAFALGVWLLAGGVRGRRVGEVPSCRACGFDLSGLAAGPGGASGAARRCPECGSDLRRARAVKLRRVRRSVARIVVGAVLVAPLLAVVGLRAANVRVDWNDWKPTWMLIGELGRGSYWDAEPAAMELWDRHSRRALSAEQLSRVLDGCLDRQRADPLIWGDGSWSRLIGAAYDAGAVSAEQRDRHVRQLFANFYRVQPSVRERYIVGEPFPYDDAYVDFYPDPPMRSTWLPFGHVLGMAAHLEFAALDGAPVEVRPKPNGSVGAVDRVGPVGWWVQFGNPSGNGTGHAAMSGPYNYLAPVSPGVGAHELSLAWRIDVFFMSPSDPPFEHPFREPDVSWVDSTRHAFRVFGNVSDAVRTVGHKDVGAGGAPAYRGPDLGFRLRVTEARRLRRDGDWYYTVVGDLRPVPRSDRLDFVVLSTVHLEAGGVRYSAPELRGEIDVFFDPLDGVGPDSPIQARQGSRVLLRVIDLPRVDRVDLVLEPAPELTLRSRLEYPGERFWNEPIVIRDVPLDWSEVSLIE